MIVPIRMRGHFAKVGRLTEATRSTSNALTLLSCAVLCLPVCTCAAACCSAWPTLCPAPPSNGTWLSSAASPAASMAPPTNATAEAAADTTDFTAAGVAGLLMACPRPRVPASSAAEVACSTFLGVPSTVWAVVVATRCTFFGLSAANW
jgi:hypothetical protein